MRRFIRNIILFTIAAMPCVLAAILLGGHGGWATTVFFRTVPESHIKHRLNEASRTTDVDILFLGSSHCYRTFDPRIFSRYGYTTFNLGTSNQTPEQTLALLQRYLDTLCPRLVIMDVNPESLSIDGVESALDVLCSSPPSWPTILMALRSGNAKVMCTAIYVALKHVLGGGTYADEPTMVGENGYVDGGYVERPVEHFSPVPFNRRSYVADPHQLRALRRCVDLLRERGVSYAFVRVPITKINLQAYDEGDFGDRMREMAPYFDDCPSAIDDSLHFFDGEHLNQDGAEAYCRYLCDSIIPKLSFN